MNALQPDRGAVYIRQSDKARFIFRGDPGPDGERYGFPPFYRGWIALDAAFIGHLVGTPEGWPHAFTKEPPARTVADYLDSAQATTVDPWTSLARKRPPQPSLRDAIIAATKPQHEERAAEADLIADLIAREAGAAGGGNGSPEQIAFIAGLQTAFDIASARGAQQDSDREETI